MSRKIGFGDTYFDPDIDGDIDFDFFGGVTTAASVPDSAVDGAGAAAKVNPFVPSNFEEITENNNGYDSYTINGNQKPEARNSSENHGSDSERQLQAPTFEIRNRGVRKMEGEEAIDDPERTKIDENMLDNENFTINTHRVTYTNHSATSRLIGGTENAEGVEGEGAQNVKTEPSAESAQRNGDDDDEPVFSECDDSASDLFSDDDSLEESEEDYLDSDITEVSPLSSANMSPLPESPRRTPDPRLKRQLLKNHSLSASPKFGGRRMKGEANGRSSAPPSSSSNGSENTGSRKNAKGGSGTSSCSGSESGHDTVDLNELAKAIRDLEEERKRNGSDRSFKERQPSASYVRPRKNMTFNNDEVRRIDHENKRLLRRIIDSQKPRRPQPHVMHHNGRVASSAINRVKELRKIETENLVLLKRLQAAKPTKELSREFLLGSTPKGTTPSIPESKSSFSLSSAATTTGSGARGRADRCHSTGSLNSTSAGSWTGSGISTPSATKCRSIKSTKGITSAAATNGTIANER